MFFLSFVHIYVASTVEQQTMPAIDRELLIPARILSSFAPTPLLRTTENANWRQA